MAEQLKPGQIVKIRERLWRVDSIFKNEMIATSIDSFTCVEKRFYVPVESITPADTDIPDITRVGSVEKQLIFLQAYQLSIIHGTSPLLSMQRSSVIPTDFQLVPVVMALSSPRVRLLIADDVGLGKTIEAGLIINELIARHLLRKILIICPASLREQWQETLKILFKLDFRIISSLHKKYLEKELPVGASPWEYFNHLITSVDYAKTISNRNELLDHDWDLVIVDETHLCAKPHTATPGQNISMLRWELLERIARKTKHLILMSATPHSGYSDSFTSLIDALDVGAVKKTNTTTIIREKAALHVCQRTRNDVKKWLAAKPGSFNPFPDPDKKEVHIDRLNRSEQNVISLLGQYGNHMTERAFVRPEHHYMVTFMVLHLMKRALSSPQALRISLTNRIGKLKTGDLTAEIKDTEARTAISESDELENFSTEEAGNRLERTLFEQELLEYEIESLESIYEVVRRIRPENDSKYQKLISFVLPDLFRYSPKIIVFTRYKDTLDYLCETLVKDFPEIAILNIHGEMNFEKRKEVFHQFETTAKSILIATDCISEGINLQYLCSQVIHYELPWNPNRLEQRNGRVDRFGQPADIVHIRTLIVDNTLDEIILKRIIEKADSIREDYGFAPPFFNDENDIVERLIRAGRTPRTRLFQDPNQLDIFSAVTENDSDFDLEIRQKMEQIKNESFYGQNQITLPDIERKLRQTEQTIGSPESIRNFILSGLNLFHCPVIKTGDQTFQIRISEPRLTIPGMNSEITQATFDKTFAAKNQGVTLIDISHPLVQRMIQLLKQQSILEKEHYGRTAYKGSNVISHTIASLKILVRYVVETVPSSIVEEILTLGVQPYGKEIVPLETIQAFEAAPPFLCQRTIPEVTADLSEIFKEPFWEKPLADLIEQHRQEMVAEREHLINKLDYSEELPEWLNGITKIHFARYDILTITMGYPA